MIAGGESSVAHENDTGQPSWAAAILDPSRRVLLSAKGSVQTEGFRVLQNQGEQPLFSKTIPLTMIIVYGL